MSASKLDRMLSKYDAVEKECMEFKNEVSISEDKNILDTKLTDQKAELSDIPEKDAGEFTKSDSNTGK